MSYSPQIKGDLVRRLYQLKQKEKRPMTRLVNEAITEYLERMEKENVKEKRKGSV
jgi:predicted transcriptional regulator